MDDKGHNSDTGKFRRDFDVPVQELFWNFAPEGYFCKPFPGKIKARASISM